MATTRRFHFTSMTAMTVYHIVVHIRWSSNRDYKFLVKQGKDRPWSFGIDRKCPKGDSGKNCQEKGAQSDGCCV